MERHGWHGAPDLAEVGAVNARKRWLVRNPNVLTGNGEHKHRSRVAAYDHVREIARLYKPESRASFEPVVVYVNEGNGWELYERVSLDSIKVDQ